MGTGRVRFADLLEEGSGGGVGSGVPHEEGGGNRVGSSVTPVEGGVVGSQGAQYPIGLRCEVFVRCHCIGQT